MKQFSSGHDHNGRVAYLLCAPHQSTHLACSSQVLCAANSFTLLRVSCRFTCDDGCTGKAQWVLSSEGPCSKPCGGGLQERTFSCRGYWNPGSCSEWLS